MRARMQKARTITGAIMMVIGIVSQPRALTQPEADALAASFLQQLGRSAGVVSAPRAGDGMLARSLLLASRMWVHALSQDDAGTQAVRALLEPTGQVGARAWVEKGSAAALPYPDNFLDLVAITGLADADLAAVSRSEITRTLCAGGRAFVGRAAAEGAGLPVAALQAWAAGDPNVSVVTDALGTWAVITKPRPSGYDNWTHVGHGPDNNPVSNDSVIKWPFLPQWRQKPHGVGRGGGIVAANGRTYMALVQDSLYLRVYRSANGCMLWSRVLQRRASPSPVSFMAATNAGVWVAAANRALLLDGETGAEQAAVTFEAQATRRVKWLALDAGILYALMGDSAADTGDTRPGNALYAVDAGTRQVRWSKSYAGRIDAREIGIADGKVFFYLQGQRVIALRAATGDSLWAQADAGVIATLENNAGYSWSWCTFPASGFLCSQYGVYISTPWDSAMVALSAADGRLLWTGAKNWWGRMTPKFILGTVLVNPYASPADKRYFDVSTQTATTRYAGLDFGGGCGVRTASQDGFFGNSGGQACSFSLNRSITQQYYRSDCGIGAILSEGLMTVPSVGCQCSPMRGTVAVASAGSFEFDRTAVQAERLETGPAHGNVAVQVVPDNLDWWTHRGNANRTGFSPVTVPASPHLVCSYRPAHPYDTTPEVGGYNGGSPYADRPDALPTPPAIVGSLVFWGGTDGYVRCFETRTGYEVWHYATAGAIRATPTVWAGCVYVGSEDGYAYCLEAHSGRLVWRFRAAPADRRTNLYGHLASSWPVQSGVTVAGTDVVFAAGLFADGGTHVYALNAASGSITWQNNSAGSAYDAQNRVGVSLAGYGLAVRGTYWLRALIGRNGIFSLTNGALRPLATTPPLGSSGGPSTYGQEIGRLDSSHVIYGCNWLYMPDGHLGYSDRRRTFVAMAIDAQGNAQYPEVALPLNSTCPPAWDNQALVVFVQNGHSNGWLERWGTAAYVARIDSIRAANSTAAEVNVRGWPGFGTTTATPLAQWYTPQLEAKAIALASNAVVVTVSDWTGANRWDARTWKWSLAILARDALDTLWRTTLPGQPIRNGLALGRNGEIIVALQSGTILCYGSGTTSVARGGELSVPLNVPAAGPEAAPWRPGERAGVAPSALSSAAPVMQDEPAAARAVTGSPLVLTGAGDNAVQPQTVWAPACSAGSEAAVTSARLAQPKVQRRDMSWHSERPCLEVVSVRAGSESAANAAANTVDRNLATRWAGTDGRNWLVYDLGGERMVDAVSVVWFSAKGLSTAMTVDVSADGARYSTVDAASLSGRGTNTTLRTFLPMAGRYVRISFTPEAGSSGPSVYEVGVHGAQAEQQAAAR